MAAEELANKLLSLGWQRVRETLLVKEFGRFSAEVYILDGDGSEHRTIARAAPFKDACIFFDGIVG